MTTIFSLFSNNKKTDFTQELAGGVYTDEW
jgi:hypothetical protein